MKKRILSIVMALAMMLSLMPTAFAAESEAQSPGAQTQVVLPDGITSESFKDGNTVYDGEKYYKTMKDALAGIHKSGKYELWCKPEANVGAMTHGHVCASLTVYGNDAYISGGERDFELEQYSDLNETVGTDWDGDVTLKVYNLNGASAWGTRRSANTLNIYMENCDNMNRVYLNGATGPNNITLKNCTFDGTLPKPQNANNCTVYSNAGGIVDIQNCTFTGISEPINMNTKEGASEKTINVTGCTFTNCGLGNGEDDQWAAPIRIVNSAAGICEVNVKDCTFSYAEGNTPCNGDILIGDGRTDGKFNDVALNVSGTQGDVQLQKPGYYPNKDTSKLNQISVKSSDTLNVGLVESFAVAKVGDTLYASLKDAVDNAPEGSTITLLRDTTLPKVEAYEEYNLPDNSTLDLNGKTLITLFGMGAPYTVFQGKNAVIENGKIESNADYPLFIGNETNPDTLITVRNVTLNGGINVYVAKAILENVNVDASTKNYYAIWADCAGIVTVKSGTYIGGVHRDEGQKPSVNVFSGKAATDTKPAEPAGHVFIEGGEFLNGLAISGTPVEDNCLVVTSGYFGIDPSKYVAEGKTAVASGRADYPWVVTDATDSIVEPAVGEPDVTIPDTIKQEDVNDVKTAAKDIEVQGLAAYANTVAQQSNVTQETAAQALKDAKIPNAETAEIHVYAQAYLEIIPTSYTKPVADGGESVVPKLTMEITPMYRLVASTANDPAKIAVKGDDNVADTAANAVVIPNTESEQLNVNGTVHMVVPMPDGFVSKEGTIFVQHKNYEYIATVSEPQQGKVVAEFDNPHGFSTFTFTPNSVSEAFLNDVGYAKLADAIAEAKNGETVIVMKDGLTADMSGDSREITVKNGTDSEITVKINGKDYTLAKKNATGDSVKITYTRPSSGGSSSSSYTVNVEDSKNGTVTASHKSASKNTTVTLTVKADKGYELDELTVTDKNGKELKLTDKGNGKYTFAMPASKVDVKATFAEIVEKPAYSDVSASAWYAKAVAYVTDKGMMEGDSGKFMPQDKLTRSQMAQVLFNLEGKKSVNYALTFGDMNGTEWYAEAVRWAASEQIVNGYNNGNFGPNDPITREQLVTVLYRYAQYKGLDTATTEENLTSFADAAQVSGYAVSAMNWAVGAGVINGTDSGLAPKATATRVEVAQILMNFDQKF